MTSGPTLPTYCLVPPGLRRTPIPRELQPDLPDPAEDLRNPPPEPEPKARETGEGTGRPIAVLGPAALSAQEEDSEASQQPPRELPSASAASRRIEQQLAATPEPDDNPQGLTEEEEQQVRDLQARDREVRAHEQAHANVGGIYAGAPTYEFVTGPDGRQYAVAGQVQIDAAPVEGDPEATIEKLETVRRAALAPAEPSTQDRRVAQQADAGIREARGELNEQRAEEREEQLSGEDESDDINQSVTNQLAESRDNNSTGEEETDRTGFANALQGQAAFAQASDRQASERQASQRQSSEGQPFSPALTGQGSLFGTTTREPVGIDLLA